MRAVGTNESNTYRRTEREKTIFRSVDEHDLQNWTSGGWALGARCWRCGLAAEEKSELGVCGVVGGMMVIELLAGMMRRGRVVFAAGNRQ